MLIASLGINLFLCFRGLKGSTSRPVLEKPKAERAPAHGRTFRYELERCLVDLLSCRTEGVSTASHKRRRDIDTHPVDPAEPEELVDEHVNEREILCKVAKEHLWRHFRSKRAEITRNLLKGLRSPDNLSRDVEKSSEDVSKTLSLTEADQRLYHERYATIRSERIHAALDALERNPPDFLSVLEEAQKLFADEDRLVHDLFGEDSMHKVRRSQLGSRTLVLAILAALADVDWKEGLGY